jgi:hypothetical protein
VSRPARAASALLASVAAFAFTACPPDPEFTCERDAQCGGGSTPGRCEPAGHCSFADTKCPSGRRYGDYAGPLEGTCVEVNLLSNPTFETGVGGWQGYDSTVTSTDIAHGGTGAALVCPDTGQMFFTISEQPATVQDALTGAMYSASAWVRAAPGATGLLVRVAIDERETGGVDSSSSQVPIGEQWQLVQVSHAVQVAGKIGVVIRANLSSFAPDACFIADDVTFSP